MKDGMIDNRKVNENHQKGIESKKQRKGDMQKGQGGKMSQKGKAHWSRSDSEMTPRKA